jgi:hypothetical protein
MTWPLAFAGLRIPGNRALGFLIASDLAAGGHTVRDGPTVDWVVELAEQLSPVERDALLHTLLAYRDRRTVALGIQLALHWQEPRAVPTLLAALRTHDLGLLLAPADTGRTVEAALARAVVLLGAVDDPADRARVLAALRSAGESVLEATLLVRSGTAGEVATWGPDLLVDGDPGIRRILEAGRDTPGIGPALARLLD